VNVSLERLLAQMAQSQFVVDEDVGIKPDHHRSCISSRVKVRTAAPQGSPCATLDCMLDGRLPFRCQPRRLIGAQ